MKSFSQSTGTVLQENFEFWKLQGSFYSQSLDLINWK